MKRPVYCYDCPDRGSEACALPQTSELLGDKVALPAARMANAVVHILTAAGGSEIVPDPTNLVNAVHAQRAAHEAAVNVCITSHIEAVIFD
jgi:hypothetical protein